MIDPADLEYMREALTLARRGEGRTRPNPPVGAVVVRGGRVVGRGYHHRAGAPHAEIEALRDAGPAARGATLYVTLEPCSTQGRTGPCTAAIRAAGVRRVVVSVPDPNPAHAGRGLRMLRRAGLTVVSGVAAEAGAALIEPFAKWIATGRPLVTLKLGISADGRIADAAGRSRWITSPASRRRVQAWRRGADALMVGVGTARADDPALTCRAPRPSAPWRVIVDSRGRLPLASRVLTDGHAGRTLVATTALSPPRRREAYGRLGAEALVLPRARGGGVDLNALIANLGARGCLQVMCEGGGTLAHALLRAGLVDRLVLVLAPMVLGAGRALAAIHGPGWRLDQAPRLQWLAAERIGPDLCLRAAVIGGWPAAETRRGDVRCLPV